MANNSNSNAIHDDDIVEISIQLTISATLKVRVPRGTSDEDLEDMARSAVSYLSYTGNPDTEGDLETEQDIEIYIPDREDEDAEEESEREEDV